VPRAALFVNGGSVGPHQASTYVRMFRRLDHPLVRAQLGSGIVDLDTFISGTGISGAGDDCDLAIVQRTAVPPRLLDDFLARVRRQNIPLVVDVDDNLFALEADDSRYAEYERHLASLKELIGAADLVTVSTDTLRAVMQEHATRVALVPNMLDEFLWYGSTPGSGRTAPMRQRARELVRSRRTSTRSLRRPRCNLVYIGTKTHGDDLKILRAVMQRLREQHEIDFTLFVIGGEPEEESSGRWYRRVTIPPGCTAYPEFVPWLRSRASAWDIALAPLRDTEFNRSKSDLKFLEYAALGVPGVFSDVVPYRQTVADDTTGVLVANTTDAWCDAILQLARDVPRRERIATAAADDVREHRCLQHDAAAYVRLLGEWDDAGTDVG
jgi:hypothetical protein